MRRCGRASRRPDRRRRHFRDRRRLSPAEALPGQELGDPRGAGARSAGPGTCSAIPASARIPTCTLWASRSGRGRGEKAIADGAAIRAYVEETARHYGIDRRIRFGHKVTRASWSSAEARWTVEAETAARALHLRLPVPVQRLLRLRPAATGPNGRARRISRAASSIRSSGPRISTIAGKRIVVIGSGATAVTLVPALAETAAHVTMLQRSPTYIVARPSRDGLARWLQRRLPAGLADADDPLEERAARHLLLLARAQAAGAGEGGDAEAGRASSCRPATTSSAISRRATIPGTSALCLVPDGDLFAAMNAGSGRRSSPTDRALHRRPGSRWPRARSSRPTSSSPRPGSSSGCSAASRSRSTARRSTSPSASATRG